MPYTYLVYTLLWMTGRWSCKSDAICNAYIYACGLGKVEGVVVMICKFWVKNKLHYTMSKGVAWYGIYDSRVIWWVTVSVEIECVEMFDFPLDVHRTAKKRQSSTRLMDVHDWVWVYIHIWSWANVKRENVQSEASDDWGLCLAIGYGGDTEIANLEVVVSPVNKLVCLVVRTVLDFVCFLVGNRPWHVPLVIEKFVGQTNISQSAIEPLVILFNVQHPSGSIQNGNGIEWFCSPKYVWVLFIDIKSAKGM